MQNRDEHFREPTAVYVALLAVISIAWTTWAVTDPPVGASVETVPVRRVGSAQQHEDVGTLVNLKSLLEIEDAVSSKAEDTDNSLHDALAGGDSGNPESILGFPFTPDPSRVVEPLAPLPPLTLRPSFTLTLASAQKQSVTVLNHPVDTLQLPRRLDHEWKSAVEAELNNSLLTVWEKWTLDGAWPRAAARWWPLVSAAVHAHDGTEADANYMMKIIWCESSGSPTAVNPTSGASGLLQHMPEWWEGRSAESGWARADVFDPAANIYVGAWLALEASYGGWKHWECHHMVS